MTELPHREDTSAEAAARPPVLALMVWTLGQAGILAAIWGDMRISANPGHTAGQMGVPLLLAGQILLSTALLTDIARTVRLAAVAFALSFPITQLAGWRCTAGAGVSLLSSAALAIWIAGLLGWMGAMRGRGERASHVVAAGLMVWVAGGPLLWYLLGEFAARGGVQQVIAAVSPVMGVDELGKLMVVVMGHAGVAGIVSYIRSR